MFGKRDKLFLVRARNTTFYYMKWTDHWIDDHIKFSDLVKFNGIEIVWRAQFMSSSCKNLQVYTDKVHKIYRRV